MFLLRQIVNMLATPAKGRAVFVDRGRSDRLRLILVTSAYHMPRAMRRIEELGGQAIAVPTGHLAPVPLYFSWGGLLLAAAGMQKSERALHEYLGLVGVTLGID